MAEALRIIIRRQDRWSVTWSMSQASLLTEKVFKIKEYIHTHTHTYTHTYTYTKVSMTVVFQRSFWNFTKQPFKRPPPTSNYCIQLKWTKVGRKELSKIICHNLKFIFSYEYFTAIFILVAWLLLTPMAFISTISIVHEFGRDDSRETFFTHVENIVEKTLS